MLSVVVCIIKFSPKYYKGECRQYRVDNKEDAADNGELDDTTKLNNEEGEETIYKELNQYLVISKTQS